MWVLCVLMLNLWRLSSTDAHVFSVYPSESEKNPYSHNDTMDIIVGTMYKTAQVTSNHRSKGPFVIEADNRLSRKQLNFGDTSYLEPEIQNSSQQSQEDPYMALEREACQQNFLTSCWSYYLMDLVSNLWQSRSPIAKGRSNEESWTHLVALPIQINDTITVLGRSGYWGLGNVYYFLERQLSRFIEGHGILLPAATSWDDAALNQFQTPVVMDSSDPGLEDSDSSERKTKKKSILFPLLILFKFFKIKMILLPILLTVLLIKKLLIALLALAPNLAGLFRGCRPLYGSGLGLAPAGLLQDVTDSRGEFSNLYNAYANLYKDHHGYRTREWARYSDPPREPLANPSPDY